MCNIKSLILNIRVYIKNIRTKISQANYPLQFKYLTTNSSIGHLWVIFRTKNNKKLIFLSVIGYTLVELGAKN